MASLSYHETLTILIASVMAVSVAAAYQECSNQKSVKDYCNVTSFPDLCYNSLVPKIGSGITEPQEIYNQSAELALAEVSKASLEFAVNGKLQQLIIGKTSDNRSALSAIESCRVLFSLALDTINTSLSSSDVTTPENRDSIRIWLGAADADLETCQDGFDNFSYDIRDLVAENLKNSTEYIIISLDIISEIDRCASSTMEGNKNCYKGDHNPYCLSIKGRKLLQAASPNIANSDVVMARVGSGN
ncbi:putative pectinesterase/pectinesterase inhibitor 24 [Sesamum indicum]|uniref:Pectinesterase/pectinesterase inhibitor 24 n=1 Tax=Sesamum indicum TaxID=4182 RepID=A0A6I9UG66_SESIN|nr:putative pectinesterase/pectinesterase inhibitor 24 [Sesamum indicum]